MRCQLRTLAVLLQLLFLIGSGHSKFLRPDEPLWRESIVLDGDETRCGCWAALIRFLPCRLCPTCRPDSPAAMPQIHLGGAAAGHELRSQSLLASDGELQMQVASKSILLHGRPRRRLMHAPFICRCHLSSRCSLVLNTGNHVNECTGEIELDRASERGTMRDDASRKQLTNAAKDSST